MLRTTRLLVTPALLALAAGAAGCSSESRVLARVGEETITVRDYLDEARTALVQFQGPPDSVKVRLLEAMVRRSLLVQDAFRRPWANDTLVREFRRTAAQEMALEVLHERIAPAAVPVSEAEARRLHAWRETELHVQMIYTFDRPFAEAAMNELRQGLPFSEVADRYNLPGLMPQSGDLGFMVPGQLVSPLDRLMLEVPVGGMVGPVEAGTDGWFILRVLERRSRQQPPFEAQAATLMEMLRQRKQRTLLAKGFRELRALYDLRVEPGAPQELYAHFTPVDSGAPIAAVPPDRVLARYIGAGGVEEVFTMREALADIERFGPPPNVTMIAALSLWLESRVYRRIAWIEAQRRHLLEDPEVARRLDRRIRDYLVEGLYEDEIVRRVEVTDDDVRALYAQITASGFAGDSLRRPAAFEELPEFLRVSLRDQAIELERERMLREHTDALQRDFPVRIDQERLERLPWPAPPQMPVG